MSQVHTTILVVAVLVVAGLAPYGWAFVRARLRRARLRSGELEATEEAVLTEIEERELPESYRAFSLACLGEFAAARRALLAAPSRDDTLSRDFALCTEILVLGFEHEPDEALARAVELVQLPVEGDEERHRARRLGVVSLVRLLNGVSEEEDWRYLDDATILEPIMFWPMSYSGAVNLSHQERPDLVHQLLFEAPAWPASSHFESLHVALTGAPSGRFRKHVAA